MIANHEQLIEEACRLADEIRDGVWDHIGGVKTSPLVECPEILNELRNRCPGHSPDDYLKALSKGLFETR